MRVTLKYYSRTPTSGLINAYTGNGVWSGMMAWHDGKEPYIWVGPSKKHLGIEDIMRRFAKEINNEGEQE